MIKIVLKDDEGKEKTYTQNRNTTRKKRLALEMMSEFENYEEGETQKPSEQLEEMDKLLGFIVDVFDNQFTFDELQDGLDSGEEEEVGFRIVNSVLAGDYEDNKKKNQQSS